MAKVYLADYCEYWVRFNLAGDPEPMYSAVGMGFQAGQRPAANLANANAICNRLDDVFIPFVPNTYSVGPSFVLFGVGTSSTDDTPPIKVVSSSAPQVGTHAGTTQSLPQNCAILVRKNAALSGGRMFLPGIIEGDVSALGVIDPSEVGDILTQLDPIQPDGAIWGDLQVDLDTADPPYPAFMSKNRTLPGYRIQAVDSFTPENQIATQRRRMRR